MNTAFICVCMDGLSSAGLLKARPTSLDVWEILTLPKAVSWGVLESLRKLKTELPPRVWAELFTDNSSNHIIIRLFKAVRKYYYAANLSRIYTIPVPQNHQRLFVNELYWLINSKFEPWILKIEYWVFVLAWMMLTFIN